MHYTFMIIQINILVDKKFPVDYPKCGGSALSTATIASTTFRQVGRKRNPPFSRPNFSHMSFIFRQGLWSDTPNTRWAKTREARTSGSDRTFSIKMEDFPKSWSGWIMRCLNKTLYSPRTLVTHKSGHEENNDCVLLIPGIHVHR